MFRIYYASAIDTCVEQAFKQIEEFKKVFCKYTIRLDPIDLRTYVDVNNPIEVFGAGFGESPIIGPETTPVYKGALCAYDLRKLRECDILLVVTDLKQFCAGTMMELEYARNLGIYTIILVTYSEKDCKPCKPVAKYFNCDECLHEKYGVKNIFLETYGNKIIYGMEELEDILRDLTR